MHSEDIPFEQHCSAFSAPSEQRIKDTVRLCPIQIVLYPAIIACFNESDRLINHMIQFILSI